jgi:hypothetical protein
MREMGDPGCDNNGVSPTPAQQARAARIAAALAATGFALPGTLTERMTRSLTDLRKRFIVERRRSTTALLQQDPTRWVVRRPTDRRPLREE